MTRDESWPALLYAEVEKHKGVPFQYGTFDCCLFAADCVKAITGVDLADTFRGTYNDETGALKILAANGYCSGIATGKLGDAIDIRMAQRGDVVIRITDSIESLGICLGQFSAFASMEGLVFLKTLDCLRAWRV